MVPSTNVKKYNEVLVGNQVFVFGYPVSIGIRDVPQLDLRHPLLRSGIVAGLNRATKAIVIDCAVYPGNSGGPVVQVEHKGLPSYFEVIGVVSQFVPFQEMAGQFNRLLTNSGYAMVVPMDAVLELTQ